MQCYLLSYVKQNGVQMFTGLSAFPITPFKQENIDFHSFERIVSQLANAKVDSICPMGSTGLYPYLNLSERAEIVKQCVSISGGIPVMSGIGAVSYTHLTLPTIYSV